MAIMAPGMFLSQPPRASTPSMLCPLQTVSMESAITSRETSEYFMPSVPMAMPSEIVMTPKTCGMAPAALSACSARSANRPSPALHGVIVLRLSATPTIGLSKSPSAKPTALNKARLGERWNPWVTARLLRLSGMPLLSWHSVMV